MCENGGNLYEEFVKTDDGRDVRNCITFYFRWGLSLSQMQRRIHWGQNAQE